MELQHGAHNSVLLADNGTISKYVLALPKEFCCYLFTGIYAKQVKCEGSPCRHAVKVLVFARKRLLHQGLGPTFGHL